MITVNGREVQFKSEMTVEDALQVAGEYIDALSLVMVNERFLPIDRLKESLANGSNIKVMQFISGG